MQIPAVLKNIERQGKTFLLEKTYSAPDFFLSRQAEAIELHLIDKGLKPLAPLYPMPESTKMFSPSVLIRSRLMFSSTRLL